VVVLEPRDTDGQAAGPLPGEHGTDCSGGCAQ
jgi:hypothetical protein